MSPSPLPLAAAADSCFHPGPGSGPAGEGSGAAINRDSGGCALVRGFVLRDDVGGNTTALIDLVSALLRPCPDLGTALAARTTARPAAPSWGARFARVLDIAGQLFAKLARVAGTQIDLIRSAIETKRDGLGSLAPVEIIDEEHLHLLCHETALLTEQPISSAKCIPNVLVNAILQQLPLFSCSRLPRRLPIGCCYSA